VEKCTSVKVLNNEGAEVEAVVLGTDVYIDIAVLRIDKSSVLQVANIGDSNSLEVGDTVFTVGSPNGRDYIGTVTKGIISGLNREVAVSLSNGYYIMDVLQTDAAINPGNSGGPLSNINGEVVGINSLKLVEDEIEGMGFAIPMEEVLLYVDRLEAGKEIERPVIGLELIDVGSRYQQDYYNLNVDSSIEEGAIVYKVTPNSPAASAGLQTGDVIIKVNNTKVTDVTHFRYLLYKNSVGDTISITYNRDGKEKTIDVKLTK
jgi:serine protease Do